ncbi:MAG: branched-chain amino acid ABC transporter permease [Nitrososphaeria archaeon]
MLDINWLQIMLNAVMTGSLYVLASIGLSWIWSLQGFPNIAHGEFLAFGAYVGYTVALLSGFGTGGAVLSAALFTGLLGLFSFLLVFRPLVRSGASFINLAVASVGYGLALRYIMQQIWGRGSLFYPVMYMPMQVGPLRFTWLWVEAIATGVIIVIAFHFLMYHTKIGKAMRAVANNPILAGSSGIYVDQILALVWFLGAALAGISGVFIAADTLLTPMLGYSTLLPVFGVIALGGIGSFYGIVAASYILAFVENIFVIFLITYHIAAEYRMIVSFIVIIAVLALKPAGLSALGITISPFRRRRSHG